MFFRLMVEFVVVIINLKWELNFLCDVFILFYFFIFDGVDNLFELILNKKS